MPLGFLTSFVLARCGRSYFLFCLAAGLPFVGCPPSLTAALPGIALAPPGSRLRCKYSEKKPRQASRRHFFRVKTRRGAHSAAYLRARKQKRPRAAPSPGGHTPTRQGRRKPALATPLEILFQKPKVPKKDKLRRETARNAAGNGSFCIAKRHVPRRNAGRFAHRNDPFSIWSKTLPKGYESSERPAPAAKGAAKKRRVAYGFTGIASRGKGMAACVRVPI